jgi:V8-like Glu-specific endopeptidase
MALMGKRRVAVAAATLAAVAVTSVLSGCSPGAVHKVARAPGVRGYWTRSRLLGAHPWGGNGRPSPTGTPSAHTARATVQASRVGAIFASGPGGNHFCTASVVSSPGHNMLVTAAHCVNGGKKSGYEKNIVFIPAYRDGTEPYGVWTPSKLLVAPQWASSENPAYDVGFVVLNSNDGKDIQDVLGANQLSFSPRYHQPVRVTGYPDSANAPVACRNWTSRQSATQLRFDCGGFYDGTSGSPFVTRFDPFTGTGTIIGVIGGYQQGGDTPSVSYSSYFGDDIRQLYEQAEAKGLCSPLPAIATETANISRERSAVTRSRLGCIPRRRCRRRARRTAPRPRRGHGRCSSRW